MRRIPVRVLAVVVAAAAAVPALAATGHNGTYRGKATSMDTTFKYGKVLVRVKSGRVTHLKIEAVTTTGCGGFMDVVFAPGTPDMKIVGGSARIKNGKFTVRYLPYDEVEEQSTFITATFRSGKVTGRFESLGHCSNKGRFTAKR